ncbi:MAG: secretin N-terminal domain-containing protein [Pseudomonadota bacterium]|nr:secretin N-terminal domain-containing protein [Pseudomonadota bacterium]
MTRDLVINGTMGGSFAGRAGTLDVTTMGVAASRAQGGGTTGQGTVAGVVATQLGQNVRVMADRINNTLLIHAIPAEYARIESTLKRLDIQRAQVLIEATIVEVTLGDDLQYGLQWAFNGGVGGGRSGDGVLNTANAAVPLANGGYSLPGAAATGFTYALSNAAGSVTAMLHALASKSLLKVISSPSLMVLDNHTAAIQVGNQQPINMGTTIVGTGTVVTTNNIQYKDTGVMLGVTPSVSAGDLVTLDISQTVTDLDNAANSATQGYPTFMQRQIESKVAVRSGETLVLGGLIQDRAFSGKSGLPLLSSIPIVGALFGRHEDNNRRTELLVIFTPRVLRSDEDARAVSRELRQRMQGLTLGSPAP